MQHIHKSSKQFMHTCIILCFTFARMPVIFIQFQKKYQMELGERVATAGQRVIGGSSTA